jgi:hypothetical protein
VGKINKKGDSNRVDKIFPKGEKQVIGFRKKTFFITHFNKLHLNWKVRNVTKKNVKLD